jgi:hypothetical protein
MLAESGTRHTYVTTATSVSVRRLPMSDRHARFAYVLEGDEWVPKLQAETDGGEKGDD